MLFLCWKLSMTGIWARLKQGPYAELIALVQWKINA